MEPSGLESYVDKETSPDIYEAELRLMLDSDNEPASAPDWFDEDGYLTANPDVLESVLKGEFKSAFSHYLRHGRAEGRPMQTNVEDVRNRIVRVRRAAAQTGPGAAARSSVEAVMVSPRGGLLIVGWVDDRSAPIDWIRISGPDWFVTVTASRTSRVRRPDVEAALGANGAHSFGFFSFSFLDTLVLAAGGCNVRLHLTDGSEASYDLPFRQLGETELRDCVLSYVSGSQYFGNHHVEAIRAVQGEISAAIVRHNREITREFVAGAYMQRFGTRSRKLRGSIIVCLYGKPEYLFLQNALFAGGAGFEDYELIYVSNSPEMAERLLKDARTSTLIYGIPLTLVLLPGNAGFGAANNVAATYAETDRLLIVNPDVFPRDEDWARKHTQAISALPKEQSTLFGVPLYYDDGSMMHGGMYFEFDVGLSVDQATMTSRRLVRVEHYGKGTPDWSDRYTRPRPVPAVTGAFVSAQRAWYEKIGGFTEDFVFGHYEDADLCLKSLGAGIAPWIHDIRLWHLEGKGSTRLPVHEGGSYVNRAIFSDRWSATISEGLEGPAPIHPLLRA